MEIKVMFLVLLSLLLFINGVFVNGHQVLSSHDLAQGHHARPRKLMLNAKVESLRDKDLVSYNDDLSVESHKEAGGGGGGGGGEEATTMATSSKVSMQEGSFSTHMFTMDYSPVRRRRPVHNKALPTTITSP